MGPTGSVWVRTQPPAQHAMEGTSGVASAQPTNAAPSAAPVAATHPAMSVNPTPGPALPGLDAMLAGMDAAPLFGSAGQAAQAAELTEHYGALVSRTYTLSQAVWYDCAWVACCKPGTLDRTHCVSVDDLMTLHPSETMRQRLHLHGRSWRAASVPRRSASSTGGTRTRFVPL